MRPFGSSTSQSTYLTLLPILAATTAKFVAIVVLPVPPLPLAMDISKGPFFSLLIPCHFLATFRAIHIDAGLALLVRCGCPTIGTNTVAAGSTATAATAHAPSSASSLTGASTVLTSAASHVTSGYHDLSSLVFHLYLHCAIFIVAK